MQDACTRTRIWFPRRVYASYLHTKWLSASGVATIYLHARSRAREAVDFCVHLPRHDVRPSLARACARVTPPPREMLREMMSRDVRAIARTYTLTCCLSLAINSYASVTYY